MAARQWIRKRDPAYSKKEKVSGDMVLGYTVAFCDMDGRIISDTGRIEKSADTSRRLYHAG